VKQYVNAVGRTGIADLIWDQNPSRRFIEVRRSGSAIT